MIGIVSTKRGELSMFGQFLIIVSVFALIIWFWVLVFKLLIRANKALQIYIDNQTKNLQFSTRDFLVII